VNLFLDYLYDKYNLDFEVADLSNEQFIIAGYYDIYKNKITIDPTVYHYKTKVEERRYYFTFGHEIGHTILQGILIRGKLKQGELFGMRRKPKFTIKTLISTVENPEKEKVFYMERQANYFAGALLMPEDAVKQVFYDSGYKIRRFIFWILKRDGKPPRARN
jgi:Zn-dependent peptidase ImmA (M78 family)